MNRAALRAELERDEGKRLESYKDSRGFWTIGVGHFLGDTRRMVEINEDECTALLNYDIEAAAQSACRVFPEALPGLDALGDVRARAVVNMTFNRGERRMRESSTITPAIRNGISSGEWSGITAVVMGSPWAQEVGVRAARLAAMLETGIA